MYILILSFALNHAKLKRVLKYVLWNNLSFSRDLESFKDSGLSKVTHTRKRKKEETNKGKIITLIKLSFNFSMFVCLVSQTEW